MRLIVNYRSIF